MNAEERERVERLIRRAFDEGELGRAATLTIEVYGPEILGVLAARLRSESDASEVFSIFCEAFWTGLPGFQWRSSVRVWAHVLARHAASRYAAAPQRKRGTHVPLSVAEGLGRLIDGVRTTTLGHLRTESRSRMQQLREELPAEDQELLILRVDKQLSFRELAQVMSPEGDALDEASLERLAARLRKRFQLAKQRLRTLAERDGLIGPG